MAGGRGFADERTALAWKRTALSILAGSAAITRLTYGRLGIWALAALGLALPLGMWVLFESRLRYAHNADTEPRGRSRGGRSAAAVALAVVVIAAIELAALLGK